MRRALTATIVVWVAALTPATAYYHYNRYTPDGIIQEKFDLAALPNRTLTFFVAQTGELEYGPNDSLPAVLNQIRQAALAWNDPRSALQVAFGGLTERTAPEGTPHGLVVFEDIPPGWVAYSTRTVSEPVSGPDGAFVPVTQGVVHLNRNLAERPGPSYMDAFFTTVVHEMGHVLGLQHTYTSGAMSTVTRATVRMKPVETDDAAALAVLYPNRPQLAKYGSIAGRVTADGLPVHMASVVALPPAGSPISTLTGPDGTYRIDHLPPGNYWIYVHPLPPNPDLQLPRNAAGEEVPPGPPFATLFYPGTRDPEQFATIEVTHGAAIDGIDFAVEQRESVPIHDIATYVWTGAGYSTPAYANTAAETEVLAAVGTGLVSGDAPVPGLDVRVLGGSAEVYSVLQFEGALALYLSFPQGEATGPRHILFTLPDDAYVLPAGVILSDRPAPAVTALAANPDGTVTVTGTGLNEGSRVYFDGVPGAVRVPFDGETGSVVVMPPAGASEDAAAVAIYNPDGQTSLATQSNDPPLHLYGAAETPFVTVTPNVLPASDSAMVEVEGINTHFEQGQVTLGFGTSDVHTQDVWVLSPTRLIANVTTAGGAAEGASLLTVMSGFQVVTQPAGFLVQAPNPEKPSIRLPVLNAHPDHRVIYAGAAVEILGRNLSLDPANTTVSLNDQPVEVLSATPERVYIMVPMEMPVGPAVLRLHNGAESANPVVVEIGTAPPQLNAVLSSSGTPLYAGSPARVGDVVNLVVAGVNLADLKSPSSLRVSVGCVEMRTVAVVPLSHQPGVLVAQAVVEPTTPGIQVPVTVSVDGGPQSNVFYIAVQ